MVSYDYYRIFYYVAKYKSFTKAAKMLDNSQPNITRCMNNLESELSCKLFVRSNQGIVLTPEGEELFVHVAAAHEQLQFAENELIKGRTLDSGHITIGASETALRLSLLDKIESFHNLYPDLRIKISNSSSPQAVTALENGLVDFAVVTDPIVIKKPLVKTPLFSFTEALIGGIKYKELSKKQHYLLELSSYPFISLGEKTSTRTMYNTYFLKYGVNFSPDMEASTADQILPMVIHNLGLAFYPEQLINNSATSDNIVKIRIKEALPKRNVCLVTDKTKPQSIAAAKFLETLTQSNK